MNCVSVLVCVRRLVILSLSAEVFVIIIRCRPGSLLLLLGCICLVITSPILLRIILVQMTRALDWLLLLWGVLGPRLFRLLGLLSDFRWIRLAGGSCLRLVW